MGKKLERRLKVRLQNLCLVYRWFGKNQKYISMTATSAWWTRKRVIITRNTFKYPDL